MQGGFVTANCSRCGKRGTLSSDEFKGLGLWVSCPECRGEMTPDIEAPPSGGNYVFTCEKCDLFIRLSEILPHWEDLL